MDPRSENFRTISHGGNLAAGGPLSGCRADARCACQYTQAGRRRLARAAAPSDVAARRPRRRAQPLRGRGEHAGQPALRSIPLSRLALPKVRRQQCDASAGRQVPAPPWRKDCAGKRDRAVCRRDDAGGARGANVHNLARAVPDGPLEPEPTEPTDAVRIPGPLRGVATGVVGARHRAADGTSDAVSAATTWTG